MATSPTEQRGQDLQLANGRRRLRRRDRTSRRARRRRIPRRAGARCREVVQQRLHAWRDARRLAQVPSRRSVLSRKRAWQRTYKRKGFYCPPSRHLRRL